MLSSAFHLQMALVPGALPSNCTTFYVYTASAWQSARYICDSSGIGIANIYKRTAVRAGVGTNPRRRRARYSSTVCPQRRAGYVRTGRRVSREVQWYMDLRTVRGMDVRWEAAVGARVQY